MTKSFKIVFITFLITTSLFSFGQSSIPKEEKEAPAKRPETKIFEVITSVGDTVTADEYVKRAVNWTKLENPKYVKSSASTNGSKIELNVSFAIKPKELNPETDYTGKFTMKLTVECKDNRYKYTITEIKHVSKSGLTSAGSIDNIVPECGSVVIGENLWKKLRGEAIKNANMVVSDLKLGMNKPSTQVESEEW